MKRSKTIALVTMGVSSLALSACGETKRSVALFENAEQCTISGKYSADQCEDAYAQAVSEHYMAAPTYNNQDQCEEVSGIGNCEIAPYNGSQQKSYTPSVSAFMFMAGGGKNQMAPQPLYRSANSTNFRNADNQVVGSKTGNVKIAKAATARPKIYSNARGGFGSTGAKLASSGRS